MSTSVLKHEFKVSHVPFEARVDTLLNIKKRRENVVYSCRTVQDNVNMAFVSTKSINSNDNLFISDHSTRLPANRIDNTDPVVFTGNTFTLDVDTFLLTDIFTTPTPTQPTVPLFRQHIIDTSRFDPDDATHSILSLEVLDTNLKTVSDITDLLVTTTSILDVNHGVVFNNLETDFDDLANQPTVFYIKYTVRTGPTVTNYVELLNNVSVYRQADFDDVDGFGVLLATRKVYNLAEGLGGTFDIEISTLSSKHAIIQQLISRIALLKPPLRSNEDPWFLNISNGKFFTTLRKNSAESLPPFKYEIAEFDDQLFTPFFPFKTVVRETGITLDNSLVKASKQNIVIDPDQDFHMTVEIEDENGVVILVFTTDQAKIGTNFAPGLKFTDGIRSVSSTDGFVDLVEQPPTRSTVVLSYTHKEFEFEFTDIDFNPVNNRNVDKETSVIYIVPQTLERDNTLFFLRVDDEGQVIFSSQAEFGDTVGIDIGLRLLSSSGLSYAGPAGFLDTYTIETKFPIDTVGFENNPRFLVLGEAYVGESTSEKSAGLIDIRIRGGGIKSVGSEAILQRNLESQWNWDIGEWDGYPYPGAASYVVEIPCEVLTTNSGTLTPEQVKNIVQEHTAEGVYAVVRTYGEANPKFQDPVIGSGVIDLSWSDSGPDVTYNIYQGDSEEGPFTLITSPSLAMTTLTVSGLASNTTFFFKVTGIKDDHECIDSNDESIIGAEIR